MLETERLILRPFEAKDLYDFYEYASVEGVGEMAGWPHHRSLEETSRVLKVFMETTDDLFALVYKANGKVIGSLGVHDRKRDEGVEAKVQREIGYVLSKDYWGKGLMPEAVERVLRYCFEEKDVDVLWVAHFVENAQSKRVIEKMGFQFFREETFHASLLNKDFWERKYLYSKEMYFKNKP